MKKVIITIIILLCFWGPTEAQELDHKTYLPLVRTGSDTMSDWLVIVPTETINLVSEPSFEVGITAWTAAGAVRTRQTTESKFGVASLRLVTANAAANEGAYFSHNPGGPGVFTGSVWIFGAGGTGRVRVRDQTNGTETSSAPVTLGAWQRIEVTHTAGAACADLRLYVETDIQQNITYFADAAQLEENSYSTTYCDGDQPGCEWLGAAHASASQRSAQSRAGGRVRDLQDDYNFDIGQFISTGMPPLDLSVDSYAILPGGELNSIKVQSRVFTLTGVIRGTSVANLHANRQALLNVLKPGAVPGDQPVRIRYTGAAVEKQISAHYESGLETSITAQMACWEHLAVRFLADDPFWYEIGESSEELDSEDGATLRYVAGRLRSTGQWDDLGLAAPVFAAGVLAVLEASDGSVYFGGSFTGWNGTVGAASIDYIAVYDPTTDTWSRPGALNDFANGQVSAIAEGPNGDIYVIGSFNTGGGSLTDHIARWDGTNWNAMGNPLAAPAVITSVLALAFGTDGNLYIGGNFTDWANTANADFLVRWDGAVYSAVGIPGIGVGGVEAVTVDRQNNVYIGGLFNNWAGIGTNNIAMWDGTAWNSVGAGLPTGSVYALTVDESDILYVGGNFTNAGGIAEADYIATWNGTAYAALGTLPLDAAVYWITVAPDSMIYVSGLFTTAGGITLADRVAKWNGSSWAHLDIDLPGAPTVYAIITGSVDPVVEQNYNVWLGFDTTGAGILAGDVTVTNSGTESAYPQIVVSRTGGTAAILEEVRNETTGKELLFNYSLLDGETLTINLTPTQKSIVSSFFGLRPDAILPNSDFGSFALQPGDNLVTCFVATDATVEAFLIWESTYWSND